jgi:hypothetical protein
MKDLDEPARTAPAAGPAAPASDRWRRIAQGTPLGRGASSTRIPAVPAGERSARRFAVKMAVSFTTIDPLRDPADGRLYYDTGEGEQLLDLSRRGACLRLERAPEDGTRLLLRLQPPGARAPVDLIARTRWSRVEYLPGDHGARACARVGLELIGGSREALDRYEYGVQLVADGRSALLAAAEATG